MKLKCFYTAKETVELRDSFENGRKYLLAFCVTESAVLISVLKKLNIMKIKHTINKQANAVGGKFSEDDIW